MPLPPIECEYTGQPNENPLSRPVHLEVHLVVIAKQNVTEISTVNKEPNQSPPDNPNDKSPKWVAQVKGNKSTCPVAGFLTGKESCVSLITQSASSSKQSRYQNHHHNDQTMGKQSH